MDLKALTELLLSPQRKALREDQLSISELTIPSRSWTFAVRTASVFLVQVPGPINMVTGPFIAGDRTMMVEWCPSVMRMPMVKCKWCLTRIQNRLISFLIQQELAGTISLFPTL